MPELQVPFPSIRAAFFIGKERGLLVNERVLARQIAEEALTAGDVAFVNPQDVITACATAAIEDRLPPQDIVSPVPLTRFVAVGSLLAHAAKTHQEDQFVRAHAQWAACAAEELAAERTEIVTQAMSKQPVSTGDARTLLSQLDITRSLVDLGNEYEVMVPLAWYMDAMRAVISGGMVESDETTAMLFHTLGGVMEQSVIPDHTAD